MVPFASMAAFHFPTCSGPQQVVEAHPLSPSIIPFHFHFHYHYHFPRQAARTKVAESRGEPAQIRIKTLIICEGQQLMTASVRESCREPMKSRRQSGQLARQPGEGARLSNANLSRVVPLFCCAHSQGDTSAVGFYSFFFEGRVGDSWSWRWACVTKNRAPELQFLPCHALISGL